MSWKVEEQASNVLPPTMNAVAAVNCSTTVTVVDLTTLPLSGCMPNYSGPDKTPLGKYVTITAEGGDLYFVAGSNFTTLNAIPNTVVYATVNATTGALTMSPNMLDYIPMGGWKSMRFYPASDSSTNPGHAPEPSGTTSPVRYVAFITASGNARARFSQSSD